MNKCNDVIKCVRKKCGRGTQESHTNLQERPTFSCIQTQNKNLSILWKLQMFQFWRSEIDKKYFNTVRDGYCGMMTVPNFLSRSLALSRYILIDYLVVERFSFSCLSGSCRAVQRQQCVQAVVYTEQKNLGSIFLVDCAAYSQVLIANWVKQKSFSIATFRLP